MLGHVLIRDINEALPKAMPLLRAHGKTHTADSLANARATIEWDGIFVTEWTNPKRNVLFDPVRDANPFFHYLESMWILKGRNDVAFLHHILPRMTDFSDDGKTFHGAYGYRLRNWWTGDGGCIDQIEQAIGILKSSPKSRQVVLGIWNPARDLGATTKDVPCNDTLFLKLRNNQLHLTVANRSNDVVLGCYGANAVQFSMLLMYMAARLGVGVGSYFQESNSFHVYTDNPYWQWFEAEYAKDPDHWHAPLHGSRCKYSSWIDNNPFEHRLDRFHEELDTFFYEADSVISKGGGVIDNFAQSLAVRTAVQLWNALYWHRAKEPEKARTALWDVELPDWQCAAMEWLGRRQK